MVAASSAASCAAVALPAAALAEFEAAVALVVAVDAEPCADVA